MNRKSVSKTGQQSAENPFTFVMSSADVDRVGDVVLPDGIDLSEFKKNPIALWSHNHNFPIGTWANLRVEGKRLLGDLKLAAKGTSRLIDELHSLIEQRVLKAVSIGFGVRDYEQIKETGGYKFTKTVLHECSLVAVPANQNALRVKGLSQEAIQTFFTPEPTGHKSCAGSDPVRHSATPKDLPKNSATGDRPMNIAEKIKHKTERLVSVKDRLTELKQLVEANDDYEYSHDEMGEIDALNEEMAAIEKSIESLEKVEKGLAQKARPAAAHMPMRGPEAKTEEKGALLAKMATAQFLAHVERKNIDTIIAERYKDDDRVGAVVKSAVSGADTTTAGWAAELVRNSYAEFMDALYPVSVFARLRAMGTALNFGNSGSVIVPAMGSGNGLAGAFVGEQGVIPVKAGTISSTTLNRFKFGVISVFSKELERASTPDIEAIIRSAMVNDTAVALDSALFDGSAAVTGVRPASILNGVSGTASAGTSAANVVADIKTALAPIIAANAGAAPVLIMNSAQLLGLSTLTAATGGFLFRDEIASGRLLGIPVISSTAVPAGNVICMDAKYFASAGGNPEFSVSEQATLTMANANGTAPTQATDGAGALGTAEQVKPDSGISVAGGETGAATTGYEAQSLFQTWQVGVRMVMPIAWGMTRTGLVGRITGATW